MNPSKQWIKSYRVREMYDICSMTEWRWRNKGILPQPKKINGQNYYDESEVEKSVEKHMEQEVA